MCSLMHGQKNFRIFVLEILLKYQVTNWWLKNLLIWSNKKADFFSEFKKSFLGMGLYQSSSRTPPSCSWYLNEILTRLILCYDNNALCNRNFSIYMVRFLHGLTSISIKIQSREECNSLFLSVFKNPRTSLMIIKKTQQ